MTDKRIEQRGLYFEEFEEGTVYLHRPGRTVTESDNVIFTTMTMNTQSLHLDAAWSSHTEFGEPLVNSMFTLSTLVGLSVSQLTMGTIVANLGFSEVSFPAPVRVGDTLYAETRIVSKRPSASRPGQGIVEFKHTMRNQVGKVVAIATRSTLMQCLPSDAHVAAHPAAHAATHVATPAATPEATTAANQAATPAAPQTPSPTETPKADS